MVLLRFNSRSSETFGAWISLDVLIDGVGSTMWSTGSVDRPENASRKYFVGSDFYPEVYTTVTPLTLT